MSNFNNQGLRKDKIRTQVKHLNSFHEILEQLDNVYHKMMLSSAYRVTNDNIDEISTELMGRPLDSIEMMVIKGKLGLETKLKTNESQDNA